MHRCCSGDLSRNFLLYLLPVILLGIGVEGCASAAKEIAKKATPTAEDTGLATLENPHDQEALNTVARSPGVRHIGQQVGLGVGQGIIDRVSMLAGLPVPAERREDLAHTRPTTFGTSPASAPDTTKSPPEEPGPPIDLNLRLSDVFASIGKGLQKEIRPAVTATVHDAVIEAIHAGLGSDTEAKASEVAADVSDAMVRQLSRQVTEQLGPALARSIREQIGPAVGDVLRNDFDPAVCQTIRESIRGALESAQTTDASSGSIGSPLDENIARQISKGATLGVHDGVTEAGVAPRGLGMPELASTVHKMMWVAIVLLAVTGLVAFGLILALLVLAWSIWKHRTPIKASVAHR